MMLKFSRRQFANNVLKGIAALTIGSKIGGSEKVYAKPITLESDKIFFDVKRDAARQNLPPVRAITYGPKYHWFGYYDKLQFDPTSRYVLGMEVDFEGRSPTINDKISIGMVDLNNHNTWIELDESYAWNWQQGCMLQWRPGSDSEIIWNSWNKNRFVSYILDVFTRKKRIIQYPIYALSPDGRTAVTLDFSRLNDVRPGYGYSGTSDPCKNELAPEKSGIWRLDLETGKRELIISIADIVNFGEIPDPHPQAKHYFNHLLFNPDGTRFTFFHRWQYPDGSMKTRMLTCNPDGSEKRIIDDNGRTSHFFWYDPKHLLVQSTQPSQGRAFYLFEDSDNGKIEPILYGQKIFKCGHVLCLPDKEWILNDTCGPDKFYRQHPYVYHIPSGEGFFLGHFHYPPGHKGEFRCDNHPRFSPDGRSVVVDSVHGYNGRQMYLIDIDEILKSKM